MLRGIYDRIFQNRRWIKNRSACLEEIEKIKKYYERIRQEQKKTEEPDEPIYYSLKITRSTFQNWELAIAGNDLIEWTKRYKNKKTFQECLLKAIADRGMTNPDFYNKAHISRKIFSAINCDVNYSPSKDTVIKCCFALELSITDSNDILNRAGYSLSLSISRDQILYYCLEKEIYDIDFVNDILYEMGEKILDR